MFRLHSTAGVNAVAAREAAEITHGFACKTGHRSRQGGRNAHAAACGSRVPRPNTWWECKAPTCIDVPVQSGGAAVLTPGLH